MCYQILRTCAVGFTIFSLSWSGGILADDFKYSPIPDWVVNRPLESLVEFEPDADQGAFSLIVDEMQSRFMLTEETNFFRWAMMAHTAAALSQTSSINFAYVPAYQSYEIHYVRVHRDGKTIDMRDNVQVRYLRQDASSSDNMDELVTQVSLLIGAVQVGDTVEVALSIGGINKTFSGIIQGGHAYGSTAIHNLYRRLLVPNDTDLRVKTYGGHPEPQFIEGGAWNEYWWELDGVEKIDIENNNPTWFVPVPVIEFTNTKGWSDVVDWGLKNFTIDDDQPDSVKSEARALLADLASEEEKIAAALEFVQGRVRYVGPGIGRNGFRPYSPAIVLERRYGDCKDKATLLAALLAEMGIRSWPALVSTLGPKTLDSKLPSSMSFNHVILMVQTDRKEYWLDPTNLPSGAKSTSMEDAYQFDKALVLRDGESKLSSIPRPPVRQSGDFLRYQIAFDLSGSLPGEHTVTVETNYYGASADGLRAIRAASGVTQFEKGVRRQDVRHLDSAEDISVALLTDLEDGSGVKVKSMYSADGLLEIYPDYSEAKFEYRAYKLRRLLSLPNSEERKTPYALPFPLIVDESIVMKIGDNALRKYTLDFELDTTYFSFKSEGKLVDQEFTTRFTLETKSDHVPPSDYDEFRASVRRVRGRTKLLLLLSEAPWPSPSIRENSYDDGDLLEMAVDAFNKENAELEVGLGRAPLSVDDVIQVLTEFDRTVYPMSDELFEVYRNILKYQKIPDPAYLEGGNINREVLGADHEGWIVMLCVPIGNQIAPYCLPIRIDEDKAKVSFQNQELFSGPEKPVLEHLIPPISIEPQEIEITDNPLD